MQRSLSRRDSLTEHSICGVRDGEIIDKSVEDLESPEIRVELPLLSMLRLLFSMKVATCVPLPSAVSDPHIGWYVLKSPVISTEGGSWFLSSDSRRSFISCILELCRDTILIKIPVSTWAATACNGVFS